ncbi:MAG TPA: MFS transporter [Gammaproteobacteria bacterium]
MNSPEISSDSHSGLSPLKIALFRNIWLANLVSNLGTWMHDVGAGWLMTDLAPDPFMVSLVQASVVLPGFLMTLPAGALADIVDRRLYILTAVLWMTCMAMSIGIMTITGYTTPWSLILFTFALGMGSAMMMPAFISLIPDLVPRQQLIAAVTLHGIGMNITRAAGPAIAGGLIALTGPGPVFLLNAVSFAGIFIVMYRYRSAQPRSTLPSERFIGALRTGLQFARQSPPLQTVMVRSVAFFLMMSGLFAFLPLIVREEIGAGPQAYGWLVTAMGSGAVIAGLALTRLRARLPVDAVMAFGIIAGALALLGLAFIRSVWPLIPVMLVAGAAWLSVVSTLQVSAQFSLPAWVRARGMAIYLTSFMGSTAIGSVVWGRVASATDTTTALTSAVLVGVILNLAASRWKLAAHAQVDRSLAEGVPESILPLSTFEQKGPVMVHVEYIIDADDRAAFEAAMRDVRRMRLRNGSVAWGLYQDTDDAGRYVEHFVDPSWLDHLRRRERLTVEDMEFKRVADAYHRGAERPKVKHFVARAAPKRRRYWFGRDPEE